MNTQYPAALSATGRRRYPATRQGALVQDKDFNDSMPSDLLSRYKPLAIRAVVAACSVKAERPESVRPRDTSEFDAVPDRDEPAIAFIR